MEGALQISCLNGETAQNRSGMQQRRKSKTTEQKKNMRTEGKWVQKHSKENRSVNIQDLSKHRGCIPQNIRKQGINMITYSRGKQSYMEEITGGRTRADPLPQGQWGQFARSQQTLLGGFCFGCRQRAGLSGLLEHSLVIVPWMQMQTDIMEKKESQLHLSAEFAELSSNYWA